MSRKLEVIRALTVMGLTFLVLAGMFRNWQTQRQVGRVIKLIEQLEERERMHFDALSTVYLTNSTEIYSIGYSALADNTNATNASEIYYFGPTNK